MRTALVTAASLLLGALIPSLLVAAATYGQAPDDAELEDLVTVPDWVVRSRILAVSFEVLVDGLFVLGLWRGSAALIIPSATLIGGSFSDYWLRRLPKPPWLASLEGQTVDAV